MCLGVPGEVVEIHTDNPTLLMGKVKFGELFKEVCLAYTPDVNLGDFVLVHVGFSITRMNQEEAQRLLTALDALEQTNEIR